MEAEQRLSLAIVCVLFLTYFCSLFFHLFTHRELFAGSGEKAKSEASEVDDAVESILGGLKGKAKKACQRK